MKKELILITLLLITLFSCRRYNTYSCHCSQGIGGSVVMKQEVHKGSKKKADAECLLEASDGESCYPVFNK